MSYDITLTRNTIPADDERAWEYLNELHEKETDEQSADFLELIEKFKEEFPCICDLSDDEVDDIGVWSDGPLSNNAGKNLTRLALVFSGVEKAMPYLTKTANENGFVVFDGQEGIIFRPHSAKQVAYQDYEKYKGEKMATLYEMITIFDSLNWHKNTYISFQITDKYLFQIMGEERNLFLVEITDSENLIFYQKHVNRRECRKIMARMFIKDKVEPEMFEGFEVETPKPPSVIDTVGPIILIILFLGLVVYFLYEVFRYF